MRGREGMVWGGVVPVVVVNCSLVAVVVVVVGLPVLLVTCSNKVEGMGGLLFCSEVECVEADAAMTELEDSWRASWRGDALPFRLCLLLLLLLSFAGGLGVGRCLVDSKPMRPNALSLPFAAFFERCR